MTDNQAARRHCFLMTWKDFTAGFEEINPSLDERQEPGMRTLYLKNGSMEYGTEFYKWLCSFKKVGEDRRNIRVVLHDDDRQPARAWLIHNAYPVKIRGLQLKVTGNMVAIASIDMEYEGAEPAVVPAGED